MNKNSVAMVSIFLLGQACSSDKHATTQPPRPQAADTNTVSSPESPESPPMSLNRIDVYPEPFETSVAQDAVVSLIVDMPISVAKDQIEKSVSITSGGKPIEGSFSWEDLNFSGHILRAATFTPKAPWSPGADQVVSLTPNGFTLARGFYVGNASDPAGTSRSTFTTTTAVRLQWIRFTSKSDDGKYGHMKIRFSEPVDFTSLLKAFTANAEAGKVTGAISDPLPIYWANNVPVREIVFDFAPAVDLSEGMSLSFAGVTGVKGNALDLTQRINGQDVLTSTDVLVTHAQLTKDPFGAFDAWNLPESTVVADAVKP
jgi:hypothetical protein